MLARLHISLPFSFTLQEGKEYRISEYADGGCTVRTLPPVRSNVIKGKVPGTVTKIEGVPAFQADVLAIDFMRDSFVRGKDDSLDPPPEVIQRAIDSILTRLRQTTRASMIRPIQFPHCPWRIEYLHDDTSELPKEVGLVRRRGAKRFDARHVGLTPAKWADALTLPDDFKAPPGEGLLLDADYEMPSVGPAIVLAATALEIFAAYTLDQLARMNGLSGELWEWINAREDFRRDPSVEEQYDALLKILTGHSLKENGALWASFKNLKTARNRFVHTGVASIGDTIVDEKRARELIAAARGVFDQVREWLPVELHWPTYDYPVHYTVALAFVPKNDE